MADIPVKAVKSLKYKALVHIPAFGTIPAQAVAPVVCPELANPSTEIDDIDIDS